MLNLQSKDWLTKARNRTILPTTTASNQAENISSGFTVSRLLKRRIFGAVIFFVFVLLWYGPGPNLRRRLGLLIGKHSDRKFTLQPHGTPQSTLQLNRQNQIKTSFLKAYQLYVKHAWGHDQIAPLSLTAQDPRNGWGATIVDSLSTLHVMNLQEEFEAAVNHTIKVNFQESKVKNQATSLFETTIRYLGGILSAYELSGKKDERLLSKAQELGDKLQFAWSFNNGTEIPYAWLYLDTNQHNHQETITIAEAGSLTLEFNRLSRWTGNDTYRRRAESTSRHIMNNPQVFPGLHAQTLISKTGTPKGDQVGWGANVDSFLEYGVKYWQLIGDPANDFIKYWQQAVDSSILHLLQWSPGKLHPYLTEYSKLRGGTQNFMSHLACFAPGNWMLGGKLLRNETIFTLGVRMTETCYLSYNSTKTGLGSDMFSFDRKDQVYALDANYILRPEVAESIWYAWRLTGDVVWQDRAWSIFLALEKHCHVVGGYSGLENVQLLDSNRHDFTESFLFSEVFKYLYLTFTDRDYFSLDEWVFSTEGHPFGIDRK